MAQPDDGGPPASCSPGRDADSAAAGESTTFRRLYQAELGSEDLDIIRVAADNGGSSTPVDVRLRTVTIQAQGMPRDEKRLEARSGLVWWLAGGLAALLAAGGVWLWQRRKHARA